MKGRLNKRLLVRLAMAAAAAALLVALAASWRWPSGATRALDQARRSEAQARAASSAAADAAAAGDAAASLRHARAERDAWLAAHDAYARALPARPHDTGLMLKLAQAADELSRFDAAYATRAAAWRERVLEIDPSSQPALRSLMEGYLEWAEHGGGAPVYGKLREKALALRRAAPGDPSADAYAAVAEIGAWICGVASPQAATEASLRVLEASLGAHADDVVFRRYLASACLQRARDTATAPDQRQRLLRRAEAVFEEVAATRDSGDIWFGLHLARLALRTFDGKAMTGSDHPLLEPLERAAARSRPGQRFFADVRIALAQSLARTARSHEAIALFRDTLAHRPGDLRLQVAMAESVGHEPAVRAELIDRLAAPVLDAGFIGHRALARATLESRRLELLTQLRLDEAFAAAPAQRSDLRREIQKGYEQLSATTSADEPALLGLRAQIELLDRGPAGRKEATRLLQYAADKLEQRGTADPAISLRLSRLYAGAGQSGQQVAVLTQALSRRGDSDDLRGALVEALLERKDHAAASEQLDALERQAPGHPLTVLRRVQFLAATGEASEARRLAHSMPEASGSHRLAKAHAWAALGDSAGAQRLLPGSASPAPPRSGRERPYRAELSRYIEARDAGRHDEAAHLLAEVETAARQDADLASRLLAAALARADWALAGRCVASASPGSVEQAEYRARLSVARGDDDAIEAAKAFCRVAGGVAAPWLLLGTAESSAGLHEDAASSYSKALERDPSNPHALRGLILSATELGRAEDARRYLRLGLALKHHAADFEHLGAEIEERLGDARAATAVRERHASEWTGSPAPLLALARNYELVAAKLAAEGREAPAKEYAGRASTALRKAIDGWPDDESSHAAFAGFASRNGRAQEGLEAMRRFASRGAAGEGASRRLLLLASYCRQLGPEAWPEAEAALRKAAEPPGAPAARQALAEFLSQTDREHEAVAVMERLAAETRDGRAQLRLAWMLVKAARPDRAEQVARAALRDDPANAEALAVLALAELQQGRAASASPRVDEALRARKADPTALYVRGLLRLNAADVQGALRDFHSVAAAQPANAEVRVALGEVYAARRDFDDAAAAWEAALKAAPHHRPARWKLLALYRKSARWDAFDRVLRDAERHSHGAARAAWRLAESGAWADRGDLIRAERCAREAAALAPRDPEALCGLAAVLQRSGRHADAVHVLDQQAAHWKAQCTRAVSFAALGRVADAEAAFERAIGLLAGARHSDESRSVVAQSLWEALDRASAERLLRSEGSAESLRQLLRLQSSAGLTADCLGTASLLISKLPAQTSWQARSAALRDVALVYAAAAWNEPAHWDAAIGANRAFLDESIASGWPAAERVEVLNNLANLLAEHPVSPDPAQAIEHARAAHGLVTELNLDLPAVADTYGWHLVLNGRLEEAIAVLTPLAEKDRLPDVHYHLAEAHLRKGDVDAASRWLARATDATGAARRVGRPDPRLEKSISVLTARIGSGPAGRTP